MLIAACTSTSTLSQHQCTSCMALVKDAKCRQCLRFSCKGHDLFGVVKRRRDSEQDHQKRLKKNTFSFLFFYTSMKSWRGYILTSVCLSLCVCLSVCE